jgi:small subunit ribosomal protein S15
MSITKEKKQELITKFQSSKKDTGSSEVQVAVLTERIINLTEHMKSHNKDFHSRRGLLALVNRRKSLVQYLKNHSEERYNNLVKVLGLRK